MILKEYFKDIIQYLGFNVTRYPTEELIRRLKIIEQFEISVILDVGANLGQYAEVIKKLGYDGRIVSFEPLSEAFKKLERKASKFDNWTVIRKAIGNEEGVTELNIAQNLLSSSILKMRDEHLHGAPESAYIGKEKVSICKLDSIYQDYVDDYDNIFLKIDTQGFEKSVLDGAKNFLPKVSVIQLEMSLCHLYEGEILYLEMIEFLAEKGFNLYSIETGFSDFKLGKLLQMDGIFVNESKVEMITK